MSSSSPSSPASSRRATLTRATTGVRSSSFSTNDSSNLDESVTVCVRCRPSPSKKIIAVYPDESQICVTNPKGGNGGVGSAGGNNGGPDKLFTFDAALDEAASQVDVYSSVASRIIESVLNGFNGTIFAYGQTGSGKTHSMIGPPSPPEQRGIALRSFDHIFSHIARNTTKRFLVRASFLEIYNEEIRDLLAKPNIQPAFGEPNKKGHGLELKERTESGVYVKDLSSVVVKSAQELEQLLAIGNRHRATGSTVMNELSSRSHAIFTIHIEACAPDSNGKDHFVAGTLHLVDLAGSERLARTKAEGDRLKEATKINLSLSALGNCISALVDGKGAGHVPYRDSKLTRLLQDSLGGNAKTLMLATISMSVEDYEETLSTLRYANRAKQIKNKPRINEDPKDTMLRQMQEEIQRLKALLEVRTGSAGKRPSLTRSTTYAAENGGNGDGNRAQNPAFGHLDSAGLDRLQAQVQSEQQSLANATDKTSQEKEAIQTELDLSMQDIERERAARQELAERLKALESNMLVGGVNIFEQVSSQQAQLIEASIRIQEQRRKERELQKQLESRQEQQLQAEESYASLQEEVDVKTRKLKKLWGIVQSAKQEVGDLQDEFRHEREDLLDTIRELTKEISLKSTILANFVSDEQRVTIESLASYHDEADEWVLQSQMSITPTIQPNMAALSMPRPKSAHGSARSEEDGGRAGHSRQGSGATRPKSRKVSSAGRVPSASSSGSAGNRGQGTPLRNEVV